MERISYSFINRLHVIIDPFSIILFFLSYIFSFILRIRALFLSSFGATSNFSPSVRKTRAVISFFGSKKYTSEYDSSSHCWLDSVFFDLDGPRWWWTRCDQNLSWYQQRTNIVQHDCCFDLVNWIPFSHNAMLLSFSSDCSNIWWGAVNGKVVIEHDMKNDFRNKKRMIQWSCLIMDQIILKIYFISNYSYPYHVEIQRFIFHFPFCGWINHKSFIIIPKKITTNFSHVLIIISLLFYLSTRLTQKFFVFHS